MSDTYTDYLKAKLEELEAQNRLLLDSVYYRDARIRTLLAEARDLNDQLRISNYDRCTCGNVPRYVPD